MCRKTCHRTGDEPRSRVNDTCVQATLLVWVTSADRPCTLSKRWQAACGGGTTRSLQEAIWKSTDNSGRGFHGRTAKAPQPSCFRLGIHQRVTPDIEWSLLLTREPCVYDSATIPFLSKEKTSGCSVFPSGKNGT